MKKKIYMELMGGIGNQLFQYFAGIEIAKRNNAEISFVEVRTRLHKTIHPQSDLSNLIDSHLVISKVPRSILNFNLINRTLFFLGRKFTYLRKFMLKFGYVIESKDSTTENFILKHRKNYIKGYFQTYQYYMNASLIERQLSLKNSSDWYRESEVRILKEKCLAVHIRRGDYIEHAETIGLLASDYYSVAIERALKENQYDRVMVFSDSANAAISLLENLKLENVEYVNPPEESPAAESLILMSLCDGIILGNSTFSYWAALLGNLQKKVYFPTPWAISKDFPVPFIPTGWIPSIAFFEL